MSHPNSLRFLRISRIVFVIAAALASQLASANEQKTIPDLNLVMIKVDAGTFTMGRPEKTGEPDESPETRVTLTKAFWIGATEVTVAQWRAFAEASGYKTEPEKTGAGIWVWTGPGARYELQTGTSWKNPGSGVKQEETWPVAGVDWNDAQAFCAWLTERERAAGRLPKGFAYRLPTEAQWEYACKAGTNAVDSEKPDDVAWHLGNSGKTAHPVAAKKPNAWGLYDMVGNVWEWCQDFYGKFPGGNVTDFVGEAPKDGRLVIHNQRGNSFSGSGVHGTSITNRWGDIPNRDHRSTLGFRIALVAADK